MQAPDWSKFVTKISVNRDKKTIFDSWTTPEGLEKWFLSMAQFYGSDGNEKSSQSVIQKEDTYKWMWYGSQNVAEGHVLEMNGSDLLIFSFLGCKVSVEIKEEDGENMIVLTQSEIPTDETSKLNYHTGCTRGWTFFLTNLKSILEGGIDLRNRNVNLKNVINT